MSAIAVSIVCCAVAVGYHLALMRPRGGWLHLYSCRRTRSGEGSAAWRSLLPIERTWFYFLPIAYLWSMLLATVGASTLIAA